MDVEKQAEREREIEQELRGLSIEDFGKPGLIFLPDGRLVPTDR